MYQCKIPCITTICSSHFNCCFFSLPQFACFNLTLNLGFWRAYSNYPLCTYTQIITQKLAKMADISIPRKWLTSNLSCTFTSNIFSWFQIDQFFQYRRSWSLETAGGNSHELTHSIGVWEKNGIDIRNFAVRY